MYANRSGLNNRDWFGHISLKARNQEVETLDGKANGLITMLGFWSIVSAIVLSYFHYYKVAIKIPSIVSFFLIN